MKHIKRIDEIFGLENPFKSTPDDDIAEKILKLVSDKTRIVLKRVVRGEEIQFEADVDGYEINVEIVYYTISGLPIDLDLFKPKQFVPKTYEISIDGKKLKTSNYVSKKVFDKIKEIFHKEKDRNRDDYDPVQDFRMAFRTR